ncbi:MAG: methyltransferase domain-containing protein [Nocardioides sp.]|uniref:class I SAM-dependent methyltransferase n=1 Tax=Nocardioides sp. TaxID=35761 RepID=UPI0039E231B1
MTTLDTTTPGSTPLGTAPGQPSDYSLGTSTSEYERLRYQAQIWESATERALDRIDVKPGSRCLDAGSGPGVTMRQLAQRVGSQGQVVGVDVDEVLGRVSLERLHADGHRQCEFYAHDLLDDKPIPGAPYDVVYARLVLFHLPRRVEVLARLWDAVAPGGHLVVHDYDLTAAGTAPALPSVAAVGDLVLDSFRAAGCEVRAGVLLPRWFGEAGVGAPDGTDVAGQLDRLADAARMFEQVSRSLLPVAIARGVTTESAAEELLGRLRDAAAADPERPTLWPLLLASWKRKDA